MNHLHDHSPFRREALDRDDCPSASERCCLGPAPRAASPCPEDAGRLMIGGLRASRVDTDGSESAPPWPPAPTAAEVAYAALSFAQENESTLRMAAREWAARAPAGSAEQRDLVLLFGRARDLMPEAKGSGEVPLFLILPRQFAVAALRNRGFASLGEELAPRFGQPAAQGALRVLVFVPGSVVLTELTPEAWLSRGGSA